MKWFIIAVVYMHNTVYPNVKPTAFATLEDCKHYLHTNTGDIAMDMINMYPALTGLSASCVDESVVKKLYANTGEYS